MLTEHIGDLAESYALGVIEIQERARVEEHIAICPPCRREMRGLEEAVHLLAFVAPVTAPSVRCKRSLMARIEREQFLASPTRPRRRSLSLTSAWASVATIALLVIAVYSLSLQRQMVSAQTESAAMRNELATTQASLASMQTQIAQDASFKQMLTEGVEVPLRGQGTLAAARATCVMAPGKNEAFLVVSGLDALPQGQTYQVWVARGQEQQPLSVFNATDSTTPVQVKIAPPEPMDRYDAIMVTVESASGAQTPSEHTVLFGDL